MSIKMKLILLCRVLVGILSLFLTTHFALADSEHWIFSVPFQRIEAGSFMMGSPVDEKYRDDDESQVQVTISRPFEIMTTEVTQKQWVQVMGYNPSRFKSPEHCDDYEQDMCPNHPVEQISWNDVQRFIGKLNEVLGLTDCDGTPASTSGCYRLPTEAEWEYSARAGTTTAYFFGNNIMVLFFNHLKEYAWFNDNSNGRTHKVGLKKPNPYGLYDVYGNVWEWTEDKYKSSLPGGVDPLNTSGSKQVSRGGSWHSFAPSLRSAFRPRGHLIYGSSRTGFRLVRTL